MYNPFKWYKDDAVKQKVNEVKQEIKKWEKHARLVRAQISSQVRDIAASESIAKDLKEQLHYLETEDPQTSEQSNTKQAYIDSIRKDDHAK